MRTVADRVLSHSEPADQKLVQHIVRGVGMLVLRRILHDHADILAREVEDVVVSSGVVAEELGHVVDLVVAGDPAARGVGVGREVVGRVDADALGHGGQQWW